MSWDLNTGKESLGFCIETSSYHVITCHWKLKCTQLWNQKGKLHWLIKVREDSKGDDDEDVYYFIDLPPRFPAQPPEPVKETHDASEPDPSEPATPLLLEGNDDNSLENQNVQGNNSPDTEEDASLPSVDNKQESEREMRPQQPQRQRRQTLQYDKSGAPSCNTLAALPSYARPQVWTQLLPPCHNQHLYLYGM